MGEIQKYAAARVTKSGGKTPYLIPKAKPITNGCSSIGRVAVSKTVGWEFESLHPCFINKGLRQETEIKKQWSGLRIMY